MKCCSEKDSKTLHKQISGEHWSTDVLKMEMLRFNAQTQHE